MAAPTFTHCAGSLAVYDGTRRIGNLVPRAGKLEAYDAEGIYIASFPENDRRAAMRAVSAADAKAREMREAAA
ncbi:hypothetical protein [Salinarimonas rosea]|uniref:hypothetical protein n=1 Tax=Salinarimonas rosea TaxID=552063 RepID=UPI0005BE1D6D|nr:hypothetical protein [Salinarimonas rosea]